MPYHIIQRGLRRGRWANRMGVALFAILTLILLLSVYSGVVRLGRV